MQPTTMAFVDRVKEVEHQGVHSRVGDPDTLSPQATTQVLVLVAPAEEAFVETVDGLEVIAVHRRVGGL